MAGGIAVVGGVRQHQRFESQFPGLVVQVQQLEGFAGEHWALMEMDAAHTLCHFYVMHPE